MRPSSPLRIVVGDDQAIMREGIAHILRDAGFDVVATAADADDLLRKARAHRPDVVVTDIRLKEGNGIEVVRQVRQASLTSPPKIYVLSNYASPEYRHECELVGADAFFDKSGEYDRFLDTLQRVAH